MTDLLDLLVLVVTDGKDRGRFRDSPWQQPPWLFGSLHLGRVRADLLRSCTGQHCRLLVLSLYPIFSRSGKGGKIKTPQFFPDTRRVRAQPAHVSLRLRSARRPFLMTVRMPSPAVRQHHVADSARHGQAAVVRRLCRCSGPGSRWRRARRSPAARPCPARRCACSRTGRWRCPRWCRGVRSGWRAGPRTVTAWPPRLYWPSGRPAASMLSAISTTWSSAEHAEGEPHHGRVDVHAVGDQLHRGAVLQRGHMIGPGARWVMPGIALYRWVMCRAPAAKRRLGGGVVGAGVGDGDAHLAARRRGRKSSAPGSSGARSTSLISPPLTRSCRRRNIAATSAPGHILGVLGADLARGLMKGPSMLMPTRSAPALVFVGAGRRPRCRSGSPR